MVRAKFRCTDVNEYKAEEWENGMAKLDAEGKPIRTKQSEVITLAAVTSSGDDPNKTWAKYTPSGQLRMQVDNPDAWGAFAVGAEYFIDFTKAE